MTYLLDANTCIRYLNGLSESIRRRVESTDAGELALCSIVKAELFYGAFKSGRPDANLPPTTAPCASGIATATRPWPWPTSTHRLRRWPSCPTVVAGDQRGGVHFLVFEEPDV